MERLQLVRPPNPTPTNNHPLKKTKTMNTYKLLPAALAAILLTACTNTQLPEATPAPAKQITITAYTAGHTNDADTRLAYTDGDNTQANKKLTVSWGEVAGEKPDNPNPDAIMLYRGAESRIFTLQSKTGNQGTFTGTAFTVETGTYNAFYPAAKALQAPGEPSNAAPATAYNQCVFNMAGQAQTGDRDASHLSNYHYMTATNQADVENIKFAHRVAILKLIITLPVGENPSAVVFGNPLNKDMILTQNAANAASNLTKDYCQTLNLQPATVDGKVSNAFTAYMAVLPTTLTAKYKIEVHSFNGTAPILRRFENTLGNPLTITAGNVYDIVLTEGDLPQVYGSTFPAVEYGKAMPNPVWTDKTQASTKLTGEGTEASPYLIETAADLKYFYSTLSATETAESADKGKYYLLTSNLRIETTTTAWASKYFYGAQFDGDGHSITRNTATAIPNYLGLWSAVSSNSTVKNLTVGIRINFTQGASNFAGGICGKNSGTIQGCTNTGNIQVSSTGTYPAFAGGICGSNGTGRTGEIKKIENCTNTGAISANSEADAEAGGICGENNGGTTKLCKNEETVSAISSSSSKTAYAGGICGRQSSGATESGENTGTVTATNTAGNAYAGGVCGYNQYAPIKASHNAAAITANGGSSTKAWAGGVCGFNSGNNSSKAEIHTSSNSSAAITVNEGGTYRGSIVGRNANADFSIAYTCCYSTGAALTATPPLPYIGGTDNNTRKDCDDHTKYP